MAEEYTSKLTGLSLKVVKEKKNSREVEVERLVRKRGSDELEVETRTREIPNNIWPLIMENYE